MEQSMRTAIQTALGQLIEKYGPSSADEVHLVQHAADLTTQTNGCKKLVPGCLLLNVPKPDANVTVLFPWRSNRRYQELKNICQGDVLGKPSMVRSRLVAPRGLSLRDAMYREMDLLQWITGSRIVSVFASIANESAANLALALDTGVRCGMELSVALDANACPHDRHEIFTQRGVACDQVVDTIIRPHSLYCLTDNGVETFTDTDYELFGLPPESIFLVRAAHDVLVKPQQHRRNALDHSVLCDLVELAYRSDAGRKRLDYARDAA